MLSPFRMVCRDFILPEFCKPCLLLFLRNLFYLTCQKETPQTPKRKPLGARRSLNPVFTKFSVIEKFPSRMVNELIASPTVRLLRFARGTAGQKSRAVSAATNGSNARFWWLTSFTLRDDHVESTSRRTAARYASTRSVAPFFGAPLPFLWARPKKWGGKGVCWGFALAKSNAGTFASASAQKKRGGIIPLVFSSSQAP